jgi:hypothetical protein
MASFDIEVGFIPVISREGEIEIMAPVFLNFLYWTK